MGSLAFWRAVVNDRSNFLGRVIDLLERERVRYCVIDGVGVNAYAEPVVTQDLDIVIGIDDMERARALLAGEFKVRDFEHSYNVYDPDSKLQVQVQRDPGLSEVVDRALVRDVMELSLPVASVDDLLSFEISQALDESRRASKRGVNVLNIVRLLELFPAMRQRVPPRVAELFVV